MKVDEIETVELENNNRISQIAIIEDDPIIQDSLKTILGSHADFEILHVVDSVELFLSNLNDFEVKPDIILLDINLRGMSGLDGIPFIKEKIPEVDIMMLTTFEDREKIFKALCAGACSYLSKQTSIKTILQAAITVKNGGSYMSPSIARKVVDHFSPNAEEEKLSPRQQQIVQGIVDGKSYKMIAADLNISIDTVRTHIKRIYRALAVNSKAELIKKANRRIF